MRPVVRLFCYALVLGAVTTAGCDSGPDRRDGSFVVDVRGAINIRLEGAAQFFLRTASDSDEPTSFEIALTAQTSEIVVESIEGSGPPQQATYNVERTASGTASNVVRAAFNPDRFNTTSERFIAESGTLTLTRVTEALVEGTFSLDARGTNDPQAEIFLDGEFSVQR